MLWAQRNASQTGRTPLKWRRLVGVIMGWVRGHCCINSGKDVLPGGDVSVSFSVSGQDGSDVRYESESVQHRKEVEQSRVGWVVEPWLDRNCIVWNIGTYTYLCWSAGLVMLHMTSYAEYLDKPYKLLASCRGWKRRRGHRWLLTGPLCRTQNPGCSAAGSIVAAASRCCCLSDLRPLSRKSPSTLWTQPARTTLTPTNRETIVMTGLKEV